jgi:ATPase
MEEKVYVPDTSCIVSGTLRRAVESGMLSGRIAIHSAVISYFEKLAREGTHRGFIGLKELSRLREAADKRDTVEIVYVRDLPEGIKWVRDANVDELARELAFDAGATLVTSDQVNAEAARAAGVAVLFLEPGKDELSLKRFFTDDTLSVHLKESVKPYAKVGKPGRWKIVTIGDAPMSREELEEVASEIIEYAKANHDSFIESERPGSTIVQVENFRVVITRPPLSDGLEITAVRPIVKLRLEDYSLPPKLLHRLEKQAEGILIAGAPGMGKTTFAQALAEYYHRKGKVVKTIESPRDMQLPVDVTQYSKTYATSEELHDVLLLSRPDYTFFDEMRDTKDFELYADMRLAGVGMVGVVHATSPIDAIQRFIGRVELGMIPSIIDTVIFIENGEVKKVYEVETVVKVPHGLREAELARPVVVVKDFLTGEPEYELYVFGDRTFVVPIKKSAIPEGERVKARLETLLRKYLPDSEVEVVVAEGSRAVVLVNEEYYNYIVGKPRRKLERLARRLGFEIEIRPKLE